MEQRSTKNYFQFNRGLNTESNEINFPDGYSTDERNYELLVDGSRKRRRGLQQESGGQSVDMLDSETITAGDAFAAYKWRNVAGDTAKDFIVHQVGHQLYFSDDAETISTTFIDDVIDLDEFVVDPTVTPATIAQVPAQFAQGRGFLLVAHKYCHPFYIKYDIANDDLASFPIEIRHRDFYGIDDGVATQITPATLTDEHNYNLRNRGFITQDITTFVGAQSVYPSKSMIWHTGYKRVDTTTGVNPDDGTMQFDSAKLVAEQVGTSDAPQGSLRLNPLDTTYSASTSNDYGSNPEVQIASWIMTSGNPRAGGTVEITTSAAHGRSSNDIVTITGNLFPTTKSLFTDKIRMGTLNGFWQVTVTSATTFTFTLPEKTAREFIRAYDGDFRSVTATLGQVNGNVSLPKSDGVVLSVGPRAVAFNAGRAWFAGIESKNYTDTIFFSAVSLDESTFGVCYQKADPTNPNYNQLQPDDGGTIVIPNLGLVQRLLVMRDAVLVFSDQGVWEITGGERSVFTAESFSVRKITEAECTSPLSPIVLGNKAIYTGSRGIHMLAPNQYTGLLEEVSLSDDLINSLWNDIPFANQKDVWTVFDESLDRIYFLYDDGTATNAHHYKFALVLDLRIPAWFKYQFNEGSANGVCGAYSITDADSSNSNKKVKWIVDEDSSTFTICDLNQTDYLDFDGAESPLPYVSTGWDNVGEFQRRKQAPVITVFAKRTETGYTDNGTGYDAVNESSNILTAYWDWTDNSVSGKKGSPNETYRHVRGFTPASPTDVDGYPVVVTRNKVRGRGRVLQLRFDGASGKDSHILGFSTNYKISRRV